MITDETLYLIADKLPSLTELDMFGCKKVTYKGITKIANRFGSQLTKINYRSCENCGSLALAAIVKNCKKMKVLCVNTTGISVVPEDIGKELPELISLDFGSNKIRKIPIKCLF